MHPEVAALHEEIERVTGGDSLYPFKTVVEFDEHLEVALKYAGSWNNEDTEGYTYLKVNAAYWHPRRGLMAGLPASNFLPEPGLSLEAQWPAEKRLDHKILALRGFLNVCANYQKRKE
jgi:hypothetical protein